MRTFVRPQLLERICKVRCESFKFVQAEQWLRWKFFGEPAQGQALLFADREAP